MRAKFRLILLLAIALGMLNLVGPVSGQANYPLLNCEKGAFSTEEDFMMTESEPYDGDPYISDGDLLSMDGLVCARNADLLAAQYPDTDPPADLGLDAVDIIDFESRTVAFSTDLDDPFLMFTAGDLLFSNGGVIPNVAFLTPFGIDYDVGLDAVHFIGEPQSLISFAQLVPQITMDEWLTGNRLQQELIRYKIDIWFSIEGTTWTAEGKMILDGDLLSAGSGTIIATGNDLIAGAPAGLPNDGVDFGLDAVASDRTMGDLFLQSIYFSTEILFRGEKSFTDGDILQGTVGVVRTNEALVKPFAPAALFLGLDALWVPSIPSEPPTDPNIQSQCGQPVVDFDGGVVAPGGGGSGLFYANLAISPPGDPPRRPCGAYVPVDGYLPTTGIKRFRVAYRPDGAPIPAVGTADGIRTNWKLMEYHGFPIFGCLPTGSLNTDNNGWMDAPTYIAAKLGTLTGCVNSGLRLAAWDTAGKTPGFGPANPDGHYVIWLEWEDAGSVMHREPVEHHIQLDNTLPVINSFKVTLSDGTTPVGACGEAPAGENIFKVYGDFFDQYYLGYLLRVRGGNPPATKTYGWHNYFDGTPPVANTGLTGTAPPATEVFLRDIDMTDLGASFTDCCYVLDLWVRDAALRHSFNGLTIVDATGNNEFWVNSFFTFAAAP